MVKQNLQKIKPLITNDLPNRAPRFYKLLIINEIKKSLAFSKNFDKLSPTDSLGMKTINEKIDLLRKHGFIEYWPPSPVYAGESTVGSVWHYRKGLIRVDVSWYTGKVTAWKYVTDAERLGSLKCHP